ncbi:replication initiation protein [Candidatus Enterovibrio escicola]|uniref:Uncharacterized protein n=1 Tax=Candidatus Enterovibrio escicola TaxID=1927127 RepID=A0A2A5T719_9GAMM|nr:replication initiation protein [Candidatus Enterovibrio escacola]PCS23944.1 hypothetical protein BTN49_0310 [Candidatus Enterovibrio escacola]
MQTTKHQSATYNQKIQTSTTRPLTPLWYPDEALSPKNEQGERTLLDKKYRKSRPIPTINRKLWNTVEKVGCWVNARWPCLVMALIEAGMRKHNLSFRQDHKRNLENFLRWIAYNSDAVTGCINVALLCVEISREIGVSKSTLYYMIKELTAIGILKEAEWSGHGCQDILHGGCLPLTLCASPLFYALMGIDSIELEQFRRYENDRRRKDAERRHQIYDADIALQQYCHNNLLRVWEHRHTKDRSSYKIKLSDMPPLERLAYIAKNLIKRILAKGWHISIDAQTITKMATNLLFRMGLGVRVGRNASPSPV